MSFDMMPDFDGRFKIIDTQLDSLHAALENPTFEAQIGLQRIERLRAIADMLVVPNFDGTTISIPEEHKDQESLNSLLPVIAVGSHEFIKDFDPYLATQHFIQRGMTAKKLASFGISTDMQALIIERANDDLLEIAQNNGLWIDPEGVAGARTFQSAQRVSPLRPKMNILGRPTILFNTDKQEGGKVNDNAGLHELVHIDQHLRSPVLSQFNPDRDFSHELEAYHTQHVANMALGMYSKSAEQVYDLVESQKSDEGSPFRVTAALKKEFRRRQAKRLVPHLL